MSIWCMSRRWIAGDVTELEEVWEHYNEDYHILRLEAIQTVPSKTTFSRTPSGEGMTRLHGPTCSSPRRQQHKQRSLSYC